MTLPDGSKTPLLLQHIQFITDPVGYLETRTKKYGDICPISIGSSYKNILCISNPSVLQTIFSNPQKFPAPGEFNDILRFVGGNNSLFLIDGSKHSNQRKLLYPPFHGDRMHNYGQLICQITKKVTNEWTVGTPFSIWDSMKKITMRVILEVVFGLHEGERYTQIEEQLSALLNALNNPLIASFMFFPFLAKDYGSWSPGGKWKFQQQQIDDLLDAEISDRRAEGESDQTDILTLLLSARYENGERMSNEELRDQLVTLMVGAYNNITISLTWAFYWIHYLPEVKQKLLKELDIIGENPDPMTLFKLPYLTAVYQETLRIYPPTMFTLMRHIQEPVEIAGKKLEAGKAFGCIYLLHQREDLYPEPKQFKPERFLERQFSLYEYMPFGAGIRRCIGDALTEFEIKLVLAIILKSYQLELADSRPVKPKFQSLSIGPTTGAVKMIMTGERN
ncbi:MAG: cytochrome P450 [Symploca sp. SIO1A3]|nr:cytochrome P450 [Symploca sp. SIO1A3]